MGRKLEVVSNDAVWSWLPGELGPLRVALNPANLPAAPLMGNGPFEPVPPSLTYF